MGYVQLAIAVVTILVKWFDRWLDMDKDRRKQKEEHLKEAHDAIQKRNASAFNLAITRLNRLR